MIQELWKAKLQWNETLPEHMAGPWRSWLEGRGYLISVRLPRPYFVSDYTDPQLHIFCDSSNKAYGVVAYLRVISGMHGTQTSFVMGKSRVAPLKKQTLPRLEMLVALTGARLSTSITTKLSPKLGPLKTTLWSDSQIVLYWLSSQRKTKQFVIERVKQIKDLTKRHSWKYCPSKDNPADLLTRGRPAKLLVEGSDRFWLNSPTWLVDPEDSWPSWKMPSAQSVSSLEDQTETVCTASVNEIPSLQQIINSEDHSTLSRLLRVTAMVERFIRNCQTKRERTIGPLTTKELTSSRTRWIRSEQRH